MNTFIFAAPITVTPLAGRTGALSCSIAHGMAVSVLGASAYSAVRTITYWVRGCAIGFFFFYITICIWWASISTISTHSRIALSYESLAHS